LRRFSPGALAFNVVMVGGVASVLTVLLMGNPSVPAWALGVMWAVAAGVILLRMRRWLRRLAHSPEPAPVITAALERDVDFYQRLDPDGQRRFRHAVRYFLLDQTITGVGIKVDDELRALVAASAVILSFGMPEYEWDATRDIVVYPDAFDEDYTIGKGKGRLGQVSRQGPIIFSARALRLGFARSNDGHNVGLHEFAHVLDFEDGEVDGLPSHLNWAAIRPWLEEMKVLMERRDRAGRRHQVLRDYGYTNEAEFFACATEMFFEQPGRLEAKAPELFALMADFYRQRPGDTTLAGGQAR